MKALKKQIEALFEGQRRVDRDANNALEGSPKTLLSNYGVELGDVEETYLFWANTGRMNRHVHRISVTAVRTDEPANRRPLAVI